jgi:hypothetical protein
MAKQASKRRGFAQEIERRRWNFPTWERRRAGDRPLDYGEREPSA